MGSWIMFSCWPCCGACFSWLSKLGAAPAQLASCVAALLIVQRARSTAASALDISAGYNGRHCSKDEPAVPGCRPQSARYRGAIARVQSASLC